MADFNSRTFAHRSGEHGFATAAVLALLILFGVVGAFMLKTSKHRAASSSNYFQARSAAFAAQSGLEAGLASMEANPDESVELINNYLADSTKAWLLGGVNHAGSATWVDLGDNKQEFAARIVAFDPGSRMAKIAGDGRGPGGSESTVYGVFELGGIQTINPSLAKYAWYMAGDARNVDKTVDVQGDAYFGGDVHFNGGADGSIFRGRMKIAKGSGNQSGFDAKVDFYGNAYFQTSFITQGGGLSFRKDVGFEKDISANAEMRLTASGQTAYFNSNITGGSAGIDLNFNDLVDNSHLNVARTKNAASVTHETGTLPIADRLGMSAGPEEEVSVDFSGIPSDKQFTLSSLGFGAWGNTNGPDLNAAYLAAKASGKLYQGFLCIKVASGLNFSSVPNNILVGKFVLEVTSGVTVNANFPVSDPTGVCLIHVGEGGSILGLGSTGLFRGYINVSGHSSVIYQWGVGGEFKGAIHHVTPTASFQMNTSPGALKLTYDSGVFDELAALGILVPPGSGTPATTPQIRLVDTRIRPFFISRYF